MLWGLVAQTKSLPHSSFFPKGFASVKLTAVPKFVAMKQGKSTEGPSFCCRWYQKLPH
jgi:hypothetical protein